MAENNHTFEFLVDPDELVSQSSEAGNIDVGGETGNRHGVRARIRVG